MKFYQLVTSLTLIMQIVSAQCSTHAPQPKRLQIVGILRPIYSSLVVEKRGDCVVVSTSYDLKYGEDGRPDYPSRIGQKDSEGRTVVTWKNAAGQQPQGFSPDNPIDNGTLIPEDCDPQVVANGGYVTAAPLPIEKLPIIKDLRETSNSFFEKFVERGKTEVIEPFFTTVGLRKDLLKSLHPAQRFEVYSSLMSAGIANAFNRPNIDEHLGCLAIYYRAGRALGNFMQSSPGNSLRFEIYKDKLLEMLGSIADINAEVFESINNPLMCFEKVYVPITFLDNVHQSCNISDIDVSTLAFDPGNLPNFGLQQISATSIDLPIPASPESAELTNSSLQLLVAEIKEDGRKMLETSNGGTGSLEPFPNIISAPLSTLKKGTPLTESEKNFCIAKGSIRYLYENPEATLDDAVRNCISIVNGFLYDGPIEASARLATFNVWGSTLEARQNDIRKFLTLVDARNLCQVGRWPIHIDLMKKISDSSSVNLIQEHYKPAIEKLSQAEKDQILRELNTSADSKTVVRQLPIKKYVFSRIDVSGNLLSCGFFSTQWSSRAQAARFVHANYGGLPETDQFCPQKFTNLYGINMLEVPNHFQNMLLDSSRKMLNKLVENIDELEGNEERLGNGYMWLASVLHRPIFITFSRMDADNVFGDFWSVYPVATAGDAIERMRPIFAWNDAITGINRGGHYNALIERGDFIGKAKLIRHNR